LHVNMAVRHSGAELLGVSLAGCESGRSLCLGSGFMPAFRAEIVPSLPLAVVIELTGPIKIISILRQPTPTRLYVAKCILRQLHPGL